MAIIPLAAILSSICCEAQEPIHITFDGPPVQPPGTSFVIRTYDEAGVSFNDMGSFGLGRVGSNPPPGLPDNGTAYLDTGFGGKLMFRFTNGSLFALRSVDLAEYGTGLPDAFTVHFIGYRVDGSTVTQDFTPDGIIDGTGPIQDFQTFHFGPEFSGLSRVEIPTFPWSLDNLVLEVVSEPRIVTIQSPAHAVFFTPGELVALSASVTNVATNSPLRAEFFIDGQSVGVDDFSPYAVGWLATPGAHVLRVTATGSNGYSASSPGRLFFVAEPLLPLGSKWSYSSDTNLGTAWREPGFDDRGWLDGNGQFGFGNGNETTVLSASTPGGPIITYYFRHRLTNELTRFNYTTIKLLRDDGAVVYLNGRELGRFNLPLPPEPVLFGTFALTNVGVPTGQVFPTNERLEPEVDLLPLPVSAYASGTNVLAVEVHQSRVVMPPSIFDLSFDLALFASAYHPGAVLAIEVRSDWVNLRWPDYLEDWALEHSSDLITWSPVDAFRGTVNGLFRVTVGRQTHEFFRLRQASGP